MSNTWRRQHPSAQEPGFLTLEHRLWPCFLPMEMEMKMEMEMAWPSAKNMKLEPHGLRYRCMLGFRDAVLLKPCYAVPCHAMPCCAALCLCRRHGGRCLRHHLEGAAGCVGSGPAELVVPSVA